MENEIKYIEDLAACFDEVMEDFVQYLNIKTNVVVNLPTCDNVYCELSEEDEKLYEEIEESDDYLALPDQYDLHELEIMRDFARRYPNEQMSNDMIELLYNKKPYRHFKDYINYRGIAQSYYSYKEQAFIKIAEEWCEQHNLIYPHKNK